MSFIHTKRIFLKKINYENKNLQKTITKMLANNVVWF